MSPREFLSLADRLLGETTEADWRTAISRAYYAAFHESRELLASWGFVIRQADQAHTGVSRRLTCSGSPQLVNLGRSLSDLKRMRNVADYDLHCTITRQGACDEVLKVNRLLTAHTAFTDNERRLAIEGIRRYERDVLREVTWRSPN